MAKTFSGKTVIKILSRDFGFYFVSQNGSHVKLTKMNNGYIVFAGNDIAAGQVQNFALIAAHKDNATEDNLAAGLAFYTRAAASGAWTEKTGDSMFISSGGNVGIGTTSPGSNRLFVLADVVNEYLVTFHSDGNAVSRIGIDILAGTDDNTGTNVHVEFSDGDNTSVGQITSSGGTVTYGAFTANHDVRVPEAYNALGYSYGTLMCVTGVSLKEGMQRGIEYNVDTCKAGDNKKVLGAYAGKYDREPNLHQVYVLGDGHIRVNGEGGNISVGDAIMVSATEGVGTKAYKSGMTIGIAQKDVAFATPAEEKLVAVQYGLRSVFADSQFYVDPVTGNLGLGTTTPTYKLHVIGDVAATSFVNISTKTSKKDITYLNSSDEQSILSKIKNVNVATYNYKFEECGDNTVPNLASNPSEAKLGTDTCKKRLGLIAEEAPPEVLDSSGKGVDIYKMASFLLAGMKAQQTTIEQLTTDIKQLTKEHLTSNTLQLTKEQLTGQVLSVSGQVLADVKGITGYLGKWSVDENGKLITEEVVTKRLEVGTPTVPTGITVYDKLGKAGCLVIENVETGAMSLKAGGCGDSSPVAQNDGGVVQNDPSTGSGSNIATTTETATSTSP